MKMVANVESWATQSQLELENEAQPLEYSSEHIPLRVPSVEFDFDECVEDIEVINAENLTTYKLGCFWFG